MSLFYAGNVGENQGSFCGFPHASHSMCRSKQVCMDNASVEPASSTAWPPWLHNSRESSFAGTLQFFAQPCLSVSLLMICQLSTVETLQQFFPTSTVAEDPWVSRPSLATGFSTTLGKAQHQRFSSYSAASTAVLPSAHFLLTWVMSATRWELALPWVLTLHSRLRPPL